MFQAPSGVSLSTPARRRPRTNQQQLAILTDFYWNVTAYPNRQQLQQLAQQLGFGHDSVNTWLRITHIATWPLYSDMLVIMAIFFHLSRFQNQRQSLRRNGRDDRLIQTGHRRSSIHNQNQAVPLSTATAAPPPLNNPSMTDTYDDDGDGPSSDDPPSDEQAQWNYSSQEEQEDNNNHFHQHQNHPPLYRPIPHHASTMNPFAGASSTRPIQHSHTSAFTTNTAITAPGSSGGQIHHHQVQNFNIPQQPPQQHHAGKTTSASGKQPLDFFFYHYDYPMQSIAEAKLLDHSSTTPSSQQQHHQ